MGRVSCFGTPCHRSSRSITSGSVGTPSTLCTQSFNDAASAGSSSKESGSSGGTITTRCCWFSLPSATRAVHCTSSMSANRSSGIPATRVQAPAGATANCRSPRVNSKAVSTSISTSSRAAASASVKNSSSSAPPNRGTQIVGESSSAAPVTGS